ncbi:MAG: hypothetical protein R2939_15515 [Kofleriaceae bacterium]
MPSPQPLRPGEKRFLAAWCAALVAAAVVGAAWLGSWQADLTAEAERRHRDRMGQQASATEPERTPPPGHEADVPSEVQIGVYVNRIPELSLAEGTWSVDAFIWFAWQDPALDPGETFTLVDGEITSRTLVQRSSAGGVQYARYRILAVITKSFSAGRFPRDRHLLTIAIEDSQRQSYQLAYVADAAGSDVSSRAEVEGYHLERHELSVRPHGYKSPMGDPALPSSYRATYSQFVIGIPLARPSWGIFVKLFLALFISVGIAILGVLLRSIGERLAMAGTALFVAIINAEVAAPLILETGAATLSDAMNGIGYVTIGAGDPAGDHLPALSLTRPVPRPPPASTSSPSACSRCCTRWSR